MIWLNPAAWIAILVAAAPVLIHLLVHRRAERFSFPTLRFIQPTRLAAIRRHVLEDLALLAVRAAIIVAAVAAVAGPLIVTRARRDVWNARVVRAIVLDARQDAAAQARRDDAVFRMERIRAGSLPEGIRRAVAWLDAAPPAKKEIVVRSPLPIGSIVDSDLAAVPREVGIRFERSGAMPKARSGATTQLLAAMGAVRRTVTLAGAHTNVRDERTEAGVAWPVDVVASADARPAIDAAIEAVLLQYVRRPSPDHPTRLIVVDRAARATATIDASALRLPWMTDVAARLVRDADLQTEAARVAGFTDDRFTIAPWLPLAAGVDGRPVVAAAASSGTLVVASAADGSALVTPLLLRSIANSGAPPDDVTQLEVVPISDSQLRAWTRPAAPVTAPRIDTVERDDRRWMWVGVLMLLAVEAWMRRSRRDAVETVDREPARVA